MRSYKEIAAKRLLLAAFAAVGVLMLANGMFAGAAIIAAEAVTVIFAALENVISISHKGRRRGVLQAEVINKGSGLKNTAETVSLSLKGRAGLYKCTLRCKNLLTGEESSRRLIFSVGCDINGAAENKSDAGNVLDLAIESSCCGKLVFSFESLRAYDVLGVTSKSVGGEIKGSFNIMPDPVDEALFQEPELKEALESDEYSDDKEGFDHSEPIGIREYRQGDSYKAVHWKMSFRLGDIYVREYGEPVTDCICIYAETGGQRPGQEYDGIAQRALGLSLALLEQGVSHYMAFYSFYENGPVIERVESDEGFAIALDRLLSCEPKICEEKLADLEEHFEEYGISRIIKM